MLNHMIKAKVFDQIVRRMDVLVAVLELRFNHKRGRIAVATGRRMVRAGIAAFCLNKGDIAVLFKACQTAIARSYQSEMKLPGR